MRARSVLVVICLVGITIGAGAPRAGAAFHLMKVREVYAGSLLEANADFVELQMYQAGQNQVNGHKLTLYDASGASRECTIPANVVNPGNQETILFATAQAQTVFGTADFTIPPVLVGSGGAVCFENIDCVSWGSFSGTTTSPAGRPEPNGIALGESIDRRTDIAGGPGTLENDDDTNDSANDFERDEPSPNPNGPVHLGSANCTGAGGGPGGGTDDSAPSSTISYPEHRDVLGANKAKRFRGTAEDESGGSGLDRVQVALRQKIKGGCTWWDGSTWRRAGCSDRVFVEAAGDGSWTYALPKKLKPSDGGKVKSYTLYSRATDAAGNVESEFTAGENLARFEVSSSPIVCGRNC